MTLVNSPLILLVVYMYIFFSFFQKKCTSLSDFSVWALDNPAYHYFVKFIKAVSFVFRRHLSSVLLNVAK